MKGWILFHRELDPSLPEVPEVLRFCEAANGLGIGLEVMNPHSFDLVVGLNDGWAVKYQGRPTERPDFIICRTGAETDYFTLALLRHLERRGVRLINGSAAIELVADKLHTMQILARAGLPVPQTILGKFPIDADQVERELGFPVIVKTLKGTRGAGVMKSEDKAQFVDLAGLLENAGAGTDFILQHYVRASHGRDVRVLVVGGRTVAAMERRSLTGGFKSNVSLGGIGEAYNPPHEMAELAVRAADVLGLDVTGVDILFDEDGYRICEANSAPGFQGLERATGFDVPRAIFEWIAATQEARTPPAAEEADALADLVFGGRTRLRAVSDASTTYRHFVSASGVRFAAAALTCFAHAALPQPLIDKTSHTSVALRTLFDGGLPDRHPTVAVSDDEGTLLTVTAAAIWAAIIPWLAGADATAAGFLSLIALSFPLVFMLTAPSGRAGRTLSVLGSKVR